MKSQKGFVIPVAIIILLLILAVFAYLFSPKSLSSINVKSPISSPKSIKSTPPTDPATKDWKNFKDEAFINKDSIYNAYQIKYPESCTKIDYKILECALNSSRVTIVLNAGGHGGRGEEIEALISNVLKEYPAGEGRLTVDLIDQKEVVGTFWLNKTDLVEYYSIWGLEFYGLSKDDFEEFYVILDKMLNSLEFIE